MSLVARFFDLSLDLLCIAGLDGRFRRLNAAWERVLGYTEEELTSRPYTDFIHPDDRARTDEETAALGQPGHETVGFINRYRHRDGSYRWLEWSATAYVAEGLIYAVARDITQLKQDYDSKALLAAIVDFSADAIFSRSLDGVILSWNREAERLFGYSAAEAISQPDSILAAPGKEDELARLRRRVVSGERVDRLQTQRRHKDGRVLDLSLTLSPLRDQSGRIFGIATIAHDITQQKQLDQEIARRDRMESLGILAGGVAHEFNSIFTTVNGRIEMAEAALPASEPSRAHLELARTELQRAIALARQMQAYSGRGHVVMDTVDLAQVARDAAVVTSKSIVPPDVAVQFDSPASPITVLADRRQIHQLLRNLVLNAVDALEGRPGHISAQVTSESIQDPRGSGWFAAAGEFAPGSYGVLSVADDGRGMDPATEDRIFEPFFSTRFTGRGMGLPAVLGIVRGHRGLIRVTSQLGAGTIVSVAFPASSEGSVVPETLPSIALGGGQGTGQAILVVDDEASLRDLVCELLEAEGYVSIPAATGREAVDVFRKRHHEIAAVLLDINMPGLSGIDVLPLLFDIDPAVRVLVSSGYGEFEARDGLAAGPNVAFIPKPYRLPELLDAIARTLAAPPH